MDKREIEISTSQIDYSSKFLIYTNNTLELKANLKEVIINLENLKVDLTIEKPTREKCTFENIENMTINIKEDFFNVAGVYKGQYKFVDHKQNDIRSVIFYFTVSQTFN